ncbi:hypothetical protein N658DRAFT_207564 [Parathielavia hyrcaniae]|uniref:Uncharacterized protein n=1 Tax=Parathielavia hyrcaniae TaxID=113614 RepID=A0AAN6SZX3_9PEZI|nr:hypothetical protein N658DRAFT_207564 [Parathielavia hyrcaniae]
MGHSDRDQLETTNLVGARVVWEQPDCLLPIPLSITAPTARVRTQTRLPRIATLSWHRLGPSTPRFSTVTHQPPSTAWTRRTSAPFPAWEFHPRYSPILSSLLPIPPFSNAPSSREIPRFFHMPRLRRNLSLGPKLEPQQT